MDLLAVAVALSRWSSTGAILTTAWTPPALLILAAVVILAHEGR